VLVRFVVTGWITSGWGVILVVVRLVFGVAVGDCVDVGPA
jgi:hypothetical protein